MRTSLSDCEQSGLWKSEEVDEIAPTTDWEFTTAGPGSGTSPSVVSAIRLRFLDNERERSRFRNLVLPESSVSDM